MKRLFILLLIMLSLTGFAQEKQKIALLEPLVGEGSTSVTGMEKAMVRGELRKAMVNFAGFEAITRTDIDQMMKEQNFQRTGMVSDDQIKKLGEMSGADYICVSTLTKSNTEFYLEAYLIHLESGTVSNPAAQYGELTDGKVANMLPVCQTLAQELLGKNVSRSGMSAENNMSPGLVQQPYYPTSSPRAKENYTESALGINMKMIWVEGGEFMMGSTSEQRLYCNDDDEVYVKRVSVEGFFIGMLEVTQEQWYKVMGTSVKEQGKLDWRYESGGAFHREREVGGGYPMYFVSWDEAVEFCRKLSNVTGRKYFLPTEEQWEYAARGGNKASNTIYAGSNSANEVAWYGEGDGGGPHLCGTKSPNELGLYDMSGNVGEWCKDWYEKNYSHVYRGGNWDYNKCNCRVSKRGWSVTHNRLKTLGFRIVCIP